MRTEKRRKKIKQQKTKKREVKIQHNRDHANKTLMDKKKTKKKKKQ